MESKVEPEIMTCRACHHTLEAVTQKDTNEVAYVHLRPWMNDHEADPVPSSEYPPIRFCDFCGSDCPSWEYPARDFDAPPRGDRSVGSWFACHLCHGLILVGEWDTLARRALTSYKTKQREAGLRPLNVENSLLFLVMVRNLHEGFRVHRNGEPRQVND